MMMMVMMLVMVLMVMMVVMVMMMMFFVSRVVPQSCGLAHWWRRSCTARRAGADDSGTCILYIIPCISMPRISRALLGVFLSSTSTCTLGRHAMPCIVSFSLAR